MNSLELLLNEIQFKTNKNLEEIANEIGYSRPYLTTLKSKGPNKKVEQLLHSKYDNLLNDNVRFFQENKARYESQGMSPAPKILNNAQQSSVALATSASSYAAVELLCRLISNSENKPIEEVRKEATQLTHDRMKTLEQVLELLISFPYLELMQ